MVDQIVPGGFKASLEQLALLQDDGTYLIRPLRRLSAAVYKVDLATKDRWIRSQQVFGWAMAGIGVIGLGSVIYVVDDHSPSWPLWLALLALLNLAVSAMLGMAGTAAAAFVIFRHAECVPEQRWTPPAIVVAPKPERPSSRGWALLRAAGDVLVIALGILVLASGTATDPEHFWSVVQFIVIFAAFLLVNLLRVFRFAGPRVRMIEAAVFGLFLVWLIASAPANLWPLDIVLGAFGVLYVSDVVRRWRAGRK